MDTYYLSGRGKRRVKNSQLNTHGFAILEIGFITNREAKRSAAIYSRKRHLYNTRQPQLPRDDTGLAFLTTSVAGSKTPPPK
jgi:hypothetical protein